MTEEEFDRTKIGDLVHTPPYPTLGSIIFKARTFISIEWDDGQDGTLMRGTWQMQRLQKLYG